MWRHFTELRRRLLQVFIAFMVLFLLFYFSAQGLLHALLSPLLQALSGNEAIIVTQITSSVLTPLSLAANAAMLATTPFALLHVWLFVAPGLYAAERRSFCWVIFSSVLLFCTGLLFCFYVVLPLMLRFFANAVPHGIRFLPDMALAVDFMTRMLLLFGLCFQVPLVCVFLVRMGVLEVVALKKVRPYAIVGAFTLGMLLTPPDVFSQVMLALPLCLLYELGVFLSGLVGVNKSQSRKPHPSGT